MGTTGSRSSCRTTRTTQPHPDFTCHSKSHDSGLTVDHLTAPFQEVTLFFFITSFTWDSTPNTHFHPIAANFDETFVFLLSFNPSSRIVFVLWPKLLHLPSPVLGSVFLSRCFDSAATSFLRCCPHFILSSPKHPMYSSNSSHTSSSFGPPLFLQFWCCMFPFFLRRLRPFTRTVLFLSSLLPCDRSSSATAKRSCSLFWPSLQLLCHVAFRSLINDPIS